MADASKTMKIIIEAQGDQAQRILRTLRGEMNKVERDTNKASGSMVKLRAAMSKLKSAVFGLKGLLVGAGVGLLSRSFLDAAKTSEAYRIRLNVLLGDVKEGNRLFRDMSKYASGVSFSYEEIMGSATSLAGVMKGGVDEVNRWMPLIGDLAAASGLSIQEATSQIIRMYSAGAASADLFRERGILAMLGFQSGVSYSAKETRERLVQAWEDPASKFRGASEQLSRSWEGMMSMLGDAWFQFRNQVMESGVFDFLKSGLQLLIDYIGQLRKEGDLSSFAQRVGKVIIAVLKTIIRGVALLGDAFRGLKMIWNGLKAAFALFAEGLNRGLAALYDVVDFILGLIGKAIVKYADLLDKLDFTGKAKGFNQMIRDAGSFLTTMEGAGDQMRKQADYWWKVNKEASKNVETLVTQESWLSKANKLIVRIGKNAEASRKKAEEAANRLQRPVAVAAKPTASPAALAQSEYVKLVENTKTLLTELDILFQNHGISVQEYYDKRIMYANKTFEAEKAILEKQAGEEENLDKRQKILDKIYQITENHQRDLLQLGEDRRKAELEAEERQSAALAIITEARKRIAFTSATDYTNLFRQQQLELQTRQQQELENLKKHTSEKEKIEELSNIHRLEQEKQLADQRMQIQDIVLNNMKSSLSFMESAFGDAYEASGKKIKEFAIAQKGIAIVQTMISTYQAAQDAYRSLVGIPYVGPALAVAAAAAAIAAGLARVAVIKSQSFALGGKVEGFSPSPTSDNIVARLTAGEYVQPVAAVKKYGSAFMDSVRSLTFPKNAADAIVSQMKVPNIPGRALGGLAFAEGGAVGKGPEGMPSSGGQPQEIAIVNLMDPNLLDQYVGSTHGRNVMFNFMSQNSYQIKQRLAMG